MQNSTTHNDLQAAREIILKHLAPYWVKVYLFGSQAKGGAHLYSDIDIAILPEEILPPGMIALIKEELEEKSILRQVEIVDLTETSESFRQ